MLSSDGPHPAQKLSPVQEGRGGSHTTAMSAPQPLWQSILDLYFNQSDGKQIVAHQIESFNHFMKEDIPEIISMVNPVIVRGSPEIPLSGPRSALASATGLSTTAANALMGTTGGATSGHESTAVPLGPINREYEVHIEFANPQFKKPTIFENNGAVLPMMPNHRLPIERKAEA